MGFLNLYPSGSAGLPSTSQPLASRTYVLSEETFPPTTTLRLAPSAVGSPTRSGTEDGFSWAWAITVRLGSSMDCPAARLRVLHEQLLARNANAYIDILEEGDALAGVEAAFVASDEGVEVTVAVDVRKGRRRINAGITG